MWKATWRGARVVVAILAISMAVLIVSVATIDLGPSLKARAEREGSKFIDRPLHIGRLSVHIGRGRFLVEDLRIDGLTPESRPWLVAKRIAISLTWSALWRREVLIDTVEMSDWAMVIESFANGVHNWPRVNGPPRAPRTGPRLVVTTISQVRATRGAFLFDDHGSRWGVTAPNLEVTAAKLADYTGRAQFRGGKIHFQDFEPMTADLSTNFKVRDGKIVLDDIDLVTDGAVSEMTGVVDAARWPEMTYQITSQVQFPRMREIFFARDRFTLHGEGTFTGTFHLFKGGRELKGQFVSPEAGINDYRFSQLAGELEWVPDRFEVTRATSRVFGGETSFRHRMSDLGQRDRRGRARFDVEYKNIDLGALTNFLATDGIRVAGKAQGQNTLEWTLGAFSERAGRGAITVSPSAPISMMGAEVTGEHRAAAEARARGGSPFSNHLPREPVPLRGMVSYAFAGDAVRVESGEVATAETFVTFQGATTFGGQQARLPFHVSSSSWQESDRFLVGLMRAFGSSARVTQMDGVGEFDGVMVGAFRRPRIEGRFRGEAMQAFDVVWGAAEGDVVIENSYASVSNTAVRRGTSRIDLDGLFSIGFPRRDGGEELNARIRLTDRPLKDLLTAFDLADYPVDGTLTGDFHLYGPYTRPFGFGRMTLRDGSAYGERFTAATAGLRFEGAGVRLDAIEIAKAPGTVTGAAYVGWNGSYSFNVEGRAFAVETLDIATFPNLPTLSGALTFTATGSATFAEPRFDVQAGVRNLFFGSEPIGEMSGRLSVRDRSVSYELEAASPRLAVSGQGKTSLAESGTTEMLFRVNNTALDPYVRVLKPDLATTTTATASGTIQVAGEISKPESLRVTATVEQLDLRLDDYRLRNQGDIRLLVAGRTLELDALRIVGDDTALDVAGSVDLSRQALSLQAYGAANLAVLQGFLGDVRTSGRADVSALIGGTTAKPIVSGQAMLTEGRLRHFSFPHALESLNGVVTFNASGIRLDDPAFTTGLSGKIGGGTVRFAGRIGFIGYELSEFDVTANGEDMRLRFPEGMRSVVDATLALQGPASAPLLSGSVTVDSAAWTSGFDSSGNIFAPADDTTAVPAIPGAGPAASPFPLRYDVRIIAPSTLRIENNQAQIVASTELNLRGTFDRPLLFGRADIERGDVRFEGRRYQVTRGSLDFTNPTRIQPFFDIEAETRVRLPGQTYRVTLRMTGTTERLQPTFESDPPLPPMDVLALLFSDTVPTGDFELSARQQPNQREQEILQARATRALTGALSDEVGRVVQETFGVDSFQITPLLTDPYQQSSRLSVNPAARVTIGKRISDRLYLTYARSLSSSRLDEIILLEYDQNDRLGWVLSQNEDRTYALEVRKRHLF